MIDVNTDKGYTGTIEHDGETWYGKLRGIKDLVTYEAGSALDLNIAFRAAVDNYLSTCRALGHKPQRPPAQSRNTREGRYIGVWRGRHLRTRRPIFIVGRPDADVAWALASQRAGRPLPVRRPRYIGGDQ